MQHDPRTRRTLAGTSGGSCKPDTEERVLVTGHRGRVGRALMAASPPGLVFQGYDLVDHQDILNPSDLFDAMQGCSQVVHLAAIPRPLAERSLDDYMHVNVVGTVNVAEVAVQLGVRRLTYVSTIAVHGVEPGIPTPGLIEASTPYLAQRLSPRKFRATREQVAYAASKAAAEQVLAGFGLSGALDVTVIRLGPVDIHHLGYSVTERNAIRTILSAISTEERSGYRVVPAVDLLPAHHVTIT